MKKYFLIILILAGCATSKQIYLADGTQGHIISCDGIVITFDECYGKAGEICTTSGYHLIDKMGESHELSVAQANAESYYANNTGHSYCHYTSVRGNVVSRSLHIKCK